MSNVHALNRSQKRCFMFFTSFDSVLSVYSYLCYVELSICPFLLPVWKLSEPKDRFSFYALIKSNKLC